MLHVIVSSYERDDYHPCNCYKLDTRFFLLFESLQDEKAAPRAGGCN